MGSNALGVILAEKMPWIVFQLEEAYFAVSSRYVSAIGLMGSDCAAIPESKPYIRGVMPFRGGMVEVMDLRSFIGLAPRYEEEKDDAGNELMLVLDRDGDGLALIVDKVIGVQEVTPLGDGNVEEQMRRGLAVGVAKTEGVDPPVLLLDDLLILHKGQA